MRFGGGLRSRVMRHLGLFDRDAGRRGGGVSAGAAPLARYSHGDVVYGWIARG
jgi:hypothetical protein